jgi:hypothetical protein
LNERIEEVINALRIFGAESVFHVGIIHRASKWFGSDTVFPNPVQTAVRFTTKTEEGWLSSFGQFWDGLQSERVRGRKFLGLAMRRIGYAHERHRIEDKLIDLLIAAEALFLSDAGSETYRGELQYRLAQRAAFFLGDDPHTREKIYQHMKDAYKLRSQVVHGGKIRPIKKEDGGLVDMQEFVETTRMYLRDALHKMINLGMQGEPSAQLINWDELIFGIGGKK